MGEQITWTPEKDATIMRLRAAGVTWDDVAAAVGHTRHPVIAHGRAIGADMTRTDKRHRMEANMQAADATKPPPTAREPLPPGHPVTWGIITAGSLLEGAHYPHQVRVELGTTRISSNSAFGMAVRGVSA